MPEWMFEGAGSRCGNCAGLGGSSGQQAFRAGTAVLKVGVRCELHLPADFLGSAAAWAAVLPRPPHQGCCLPSCRAIMSFVGLGR